MYLYIAIILTGLVADQLTKSLAVWFLSNYVSIPILPFVLHLTYIQNDGIAFSFLSGHQIIIIVITLLAIVFLSYLLIKLPKTGKWHAVNLALSLIISGALGNFVDRITKSYVVDFIDFRLIGFPIFNVADILVCLGALLMIVALFKNKKLLDEGIDIFVNTGKKDSTLYKDPSVRKRTKQDNKKSIVRNKIDDPSATKPLPAARKVRVKVGPDGTKTTVNKRRPLRPADAQPDLSPYERDNLIKLKELAAERRNYRLEPDVKTELVVLEPYHPKMSFNPVPPEEYQKTNTKELTELRNLKNLPLNVDQAKGFVSNKRKRKQYPN